MRVEWVAGQAWAVIFQDNLHDVAQLVVVHVPAGATRQGRAWHGLRVARTVDQFDQRGPIVRGLQGNAVDDKLVVISVGCYRCVHVEDDRLGRLGQDQVAQGRDDGLRWNENGRLSRGRRLAARVGGVTGVTSVKRQWGRLRP